MAAVARKFVMRGITRLGQDFEGCDRMTQESMQLYALLRLRCKRKVVTYM